jgi:hypothetical protein
MLPRKGPSGRTHGRTVSEALAQNRGRQLTSIDQGKKLLLAAMKYPTAVSPGRIKATACEQPDHNENAAPDQLQYPARSLISAAGV